MSESMSSSLRQGRYQIGDVYLGTVENVLPGIDAAVCQYRRK
jgi:Ribonuclease G/E